MVSPTTGTRVGATGATGGGNTNEGKASTMFGCRGGMVAATGAVGVLQVLVMLHS